MAKATPEQARELEHTNGTRGQTVNGPVTPVTPHLARKLTREEALDRTFQKN